jgi:Domain of unknown function (DUF4394)
MKKKIFVALGLITSAVFAVMLIAASSDRSVGNAQTSITAGLTLPNRNIYALTTDQSLYILRPGATQYARLGRISTNGDNIIEIDFRPADGRLYAVSDQGRIYTVNLSSTNFGATTLVSTTNPRLTTGFGGAVMDFNPVLNALRLVGQNDQNLAVVNQNGGNLNAVAAQTRLAYVAGDRNAGQDPEITAGAYTNNVNGAANTLFYMIDHDKDTFVTIQDKNATGSSNTGGGRLQTIGPIVDAQGNRLNMSPLTTMDITTIGGVNMLIGQTTRLLFTINLNQINPNLPVGTTQNVVVARGAAGIQLPVGAPQLSGGIRGLAIATQ